MVLSTLGSWRDCGKGVNAGEGEMIGAFLFVRKLRISDARHGCARCGLFLGLVWWCHVVVVVVVGCLERGGVMDQSANKYERCNTRLMIRTEKL